MAQVFLGIGSNIDREQHIISGLIALAEHFDWRQRSRVFESRAVGFDGSDFYNLVVEVSTTQSVAETFSVCKHIEQQNGRAANSPKYSPRSLDIDMLLYDDRVNTYEPQLPRAEITENAFVLWPLAEIAPDKIHPLQGKTFAELWRNYRSAQQLAPIDDERWLPF
ncbi:2-amino-4-hydroxy-6-hydroxymethyldihydropteridine diphosphokinase [Idiomarina seosinensis]|uniref:2-amino-4-hydroxy-6-hydroxymethyldihydropteridine diphosphokinase n=1 Tax=Idiomarina seosinensis TaxID=281739 RepID=A0A432Z4G8_9GAMM|nr:2-amino-4-hydroxy-6-hydroxymethyldihydropteridine diphosphokinase [Idiomarina seosinensis]RUO72777.1 2-amino-4-hydroxy-6-hydroxymethyldihydropteridine diphosphokinase [Idiomarina seosinensis]